MKGETERIKEKEGVGGGKERKGRIEQEKHEGDRIKLRRREGRSGVKSRKRWKRKRGIRQMGREGIFLMS
jgi:hypothetical protein